jgi:hypothetical protein
MANTAGTGRRKPLDDLAYDLITVLHQKSKGLEAIDRYLNDARCDEEVKKLFERIRQQDEEQIEDIKHVVARRLAEDEDERLTQGSARGAQAGTHSGPSRSGAV